MARRVPVLGFCHGCHDINVALGGSLHQWLPDPGAVKHWEDPDESLEEAYAERHFVTCTPGGELEKITRMGRFPASSLHSQGVNRLGEGLVEARADDGWWRPCAGTTCRYSPGASSSTRNGAGAGIRPTAAS